MAIMYPNLLQIVALKSTGITDINQVKGRSISTGSPGSGTNFMAEAVLKALDIAPDSYKDSRLSFTENANALRDSTIDVGIWSVGPGTSSILDLATTHEITCSLLRRSRRSRFWRPTKPIRPWNWPAVSIAASTSPCPPSGCGT
jgi:TRAP transporter TAXI family solute receptor